MSHRDELLARLRTETFDLLVIGGGITGAGIARDAAMRGLKVALVEKGDFASGTSSKTSKLIHGGLRYLEQAQFRLVFECLRERRVLRTIAPELVAPLSILIPLYQGSRRGRWRVDLGLMLYDWLAGSHSLTRHRTMSASGVLERTPKLRRAGLKAGAYYNDCQMDDARLCLANILQANSFGAACANYVMVRSLLKASDVVCGAAVEDVLEGEQWEIRASAVINAGGPWSDSLRRLSRSDARARLAPTKGAHLILPKLLDQALFFEARRDRRMLFLLPWGAHTLVGTTETKEVRHLDALHANERDAEYLLDEVNRVLPDAKVRPADVIAAFAGARPLLAYSGSATGASRDHAIETDASGLVSVLGGKYTTYRLMAEQAVDLVIRQSGLGVERSLTDQVRLLEPIQGIVLNRWHDLVKRMGPALRDRLLLRYGTGVFRMLELLEFEPHLLQPVCPHHEILQVELVYSLEEELACTLTDLLVRRTRIAHSPCQGLDALETVQDLMRRYAHTDEAQLRVQTAAYRAHLERELPFRRTLEPAEA